MSSAHSFAPNWWESTGFLAGGLPVVDPDDPYRISSTILPVYPPLAWQFQATGHLFPGAPVQWQGGMGSYPATLQGEAIDNLFYNRPLACADECAMGGCADPTSFAHRKCVQQGCCAAKPTAADAEATIPFPSQKVYVETNCEPGTKEYCRSDLDYYNCMPYSTLTPATDPTCASFRA